jgi:hypothetical protein
VRLSDARRPEDQHVFGLRHVTSGGQLSDKLVIDGRLELEVELLDRLDRWEVRDLNAHGDALALLRADLLVQQSVQEIEVRGLVPGRCGENRVDALGNVTQTKSLKAVDDACMHDGAHRPPPTMRS